MTAPADAESPADLELFCPGCGYSLRGLSSDNCPECGLRVDRSAAAVSRIPWEHRRRIGRVRAYWRTLFMPGARVADDVMRPVRYRDARLFQLVTVFITALPMMALAAWPVPGSVYRGMGAAFGSFPVTMPPGYAIDIGLPLLIGAGLRVVLPVAIPLYLLAMTGVASYFFHPPHLTVVQQNRAIALSYYASAPIILFVLPALAAITLVFLEAHQPRWWVNADFLTTALLITIPSLLTVGTILLTWYGYLRMLRRATLCSTARLIALAVTLPVAWVVLAALILIGLPWLVGFAMLVVWSLG